MRLTDAGVFSQAVSSTVREILLLCVVDGDGDDAGMITTGLLQPPIAPSDGRRRGRPRFLIKEDTLIYLVENGFSDGKIAEMMCVSRSTIRRRMKECGLYVSSTYSDINDEDLDAHVQQIKESFPRAGSRMLHGHLLSRGLRVQHYRVRESLRRVDPEGCLLRWFEGIHRRKYSVPHSQALWHIDSNHKLIRYVLTLR